MHKALPSTTALPTFHEPDDFPAKLAEQDRLPMTPFACFMLAA